MSNLQDLKLAGEAPEWLTEFAYESLCDGYLLPDETPRQMYWRVANSVSKYLNKPELAAKFYNYIDRNWLCLATPVASNCGTDRGLTISCFGMTLPDSILGIANSLKEIMLLTKHGGGIGTYLGKLREKGSPIKGGGVSDGIIPWLKCIEDVLQATAQAGVRRGSGAQYLDVESNEIEDFIDIRRPTGDMLASKCLSNNFHHGVCFSDSYMRDVALGNKKAQKIWELFLSARTEKGEPFAFWKDTANNASPQCYKDKGLKLTTSQLCSEITLFTDEDHTFVCCLSSLNLARWEEWKDSDLVETATWFLDGVMEEFIQKASNIEGFERAINFAKKSRALGLGVLGWHNLLQSKMIPFESFDAMRLNGEVWRLMDEKSLIGTQQLAAEYGEPEWTRGYGVRNSHRLAVAPTFSNALISGGLSQGIEPLAANCYAHKGAKGVHIVRNKQLEKLLDSKGKNTEAVWNEINDNYGSVKSLPFLTSDEKDVFATAREINQFSVIRQAAQRQKHIDQSQSVNVFLNSPIDITDTKARLAFGNHIDELHWMAWELGLKNLYYCKAKPALSGDSVSTYEAEDEDCKSCSG